MPNQTKALIITHIAYNRKTGQPVEGPYTSVSRALTQILGRKPQMVEIPLRGFEGPVVVKNEKGEKLIRLPPTLGQIILFKYLLDLAISGAMALRFILTNKSPLIIAIDPLCALPLVALRKIFGGKFVFYGVDFSLNRSPNLPEQKLYLWADKMSSLGADQIWVVCEYLKSYKKDVYGVESFYVPNSFPFDESYFLKNKDSKRGQKIVWTGSILTDNQLKDVFRLCQEIQKIRPEAEFNFIPSNRSPEFHQKIREFGLNQAEVYEVPGQKESREIVSTCDLGLAVYDPKHGSTAFIEPIKIWEYLMCGLPFIISSEPSMGTAIKQAGVAYVLAPKNEVPQDGSLSQFIEAENLKKLSPACVKLAREFDAVRTIKDALNKLDV